MAEKQEQWVANVSSVGRERSLSGNTELQRQGSSGRIGREAFWHSAASDSEGTQGGSQRISSCLSIAGYSRRCRTAGDCRERSRLPVDSLAADVISSSVLYQGSVA